MISQTLSAVVHKAASYARPAAMFATIASAAYLGGVPYALGAAAVFWTANYCLGDSRKSPKPNITALLPTAVANQASSISSATSGSFSHSKSKSFSDVALGTLSQYELEGGESACGMIAALAASKMLQGTLTSNTIDSTLREGVELYADALAAFEMQSGYPYPDAYLSIDLCLAGSAILRRQMCVDLLGGVPRGHEITLVPGNREIESFCHLLEPLQKRAELRGEVVASIVTLVPETVSISYDPHKKEWLYFNSHGNNATYGNRAILLRKSSLKKIAHLLAVSKSYVDTAEAVNQDINRCVMYIVTSKRIPLSCPVERDFIGIAALIQQQKQQLAQFEQWAKTDFSQFRKNHFDWWMFPIDRTSVRQGGKYTVYRDQIESLKSNLGFMENYRRGVALLLASWGWDAARGRPSSNGQRFDGCLVRLGKVLQSLELFGEQELLTSVKAFAQAVVAPHQLEGSTAYLRPLIY